MIQARQGLIRGAGLNSGSTEATGGPSDGMAALGGGSVGDGAGMDDFKISGATLIDGLQSPFEEHGLDIAGLGVVDAAAENRDSKGPWRHGMMVSSKDHGVRRVGPGRVSWEPGEIRTSDLRLS